MPETSYPFTKAAAKVGKLHTEIDADAGIGPACVRVDYLDPDGTVAMADALSGAEQTALTAVIAAHPGPYPEAPVLVRSPNGTLFKLRVTDLGIVYTDPA